MNVHSKTIINLNKDCDEYEINVDSPPFSKDYSIIVDFKNKKITGSCVAFGSWYDVDKIECIKILQLVEVNKKLLRNYKSLI